MNQVIIKHVSTLLPTLVCLRHFGEYLALAVPGLAEGRPSVLVGDKVYMSTPGDEECGPQYEGYVHEVILNKT